MNASSGDQLWTDTFLELNEVLRELADEVDHVFYFPVDGIFDEHDRAELFVDFIHHTPKGAEVFAAELRKFLNTHVDVSGADQ